ncbi:MAG: 4Fe-4S binding protein [Oscillospiraceae bacterium]|nr:4Fe-4S binding protein [Oscillospiraceae bacterium]
MVVEDNLARLNTEKCVGCGKCTEVCPNKCISELDYRR